MKNYSIADERTLTNSHVRKQAALFPEHGVMSDVAMSANYGSSANAGAAFDNSECLNGHSGADLSISSHDRARMNAWHRADRRRRKYLEQFGEGLGRIVDPHARCSNLFRKTMRHQDSGGVRLS